MPAEARDFGSGESGRTRRLTPFPHRRCCPLAVGEHPAPTPVWKLEPRKPGAGGGQCGGVGSFCGGAPAALTKTARGRLVFRHRQDGKRRVIVAPGAVRMHGADKLVRLPFSVSEGSANLDRTESCVQTPGMQFNWWPVVDPRSTASPIDCTCLVAGVCRNGRYTAKPGTTREGRGGASVFACLNRQLQTD